MSSKIELKKKKKQEALLAAAFELFSSKGVNNTTIGDICDHANIAKGTFYLYYQDKFQLLENLILVKSGELISKAYKFTMDNRKEKLYDTVKLFIEYIIDYFVENPNVLILIKSNISYPLYKEAMADEDVKNLISDFKSAYSTMKNREYGEELERSLYMIIELTSTVCYGAIIHNQPAPIEEMKPVLLRIIEKIIA